MASVPALDWMFCSHPCAYAMSPSSAFFLSPSMNPIQKRRRSSRARCSLQSPDFVKESRRALLLKGSVGIGVALVQQQNSVASAAAAPAAEVRPQFYELQGSGGVKALDIRLGSGESPKQGDKVAIHYYGRLAAKQGWRFDSTYDHKDNSGDPEPFVFIVGSSNVIAGLDSAVRTMKPGGIRRLVIPPSQGYQNTSQDPLPPNIFDRQRLFTTIFNPTRIANGEGSTLGTLIFDVELVGVLH